MDYLNLITNYLHAFAIKLSAEYHVDPLIFCILFFGSAIPLYYGYYRIGKSALKVEDKKLKRKTIDKKQLKIGIIISVVAWWIPYIYVLIFGKLPLQLWLIFIAFLAIMGIFFIKTLFSKISAATKNVDI